MNLITKILLLAVVFMSACNVEPKAIEYGNDHCKFCDMTVVDKTHASEYVTKKGRSYVFDAIECMVRELKEIDEETLAFILVSDFNNPGALLDATKSTFLISEEIKSPMGENLSAFENETIAKEYQSKHTGEIYSWSQLKDKLK